MNERPVEWHIWDFLKAEAVYAIILIVVVASASVETVRAFRMEEAPAGLAARVQPIEEKTLWFQFNRTVNVMARREMDAAIFPLAVQALLFLELIAGTAVLLTMAYLLVKRGAILPPQPPLPIRWSLWDVLKLAGVLAAGISLFGYIFPTDPMRPLATPADWAAQIFARILLIGVLVHIVVAERGGRLADLGIRSVRIPANIVVGLVGFLAVIPILIVLEVLKWQAFQAIPVQQTVQVLLQANSKSMLNLGVVMAVVVAPLSEELFFRGFVQPVLQRWTGAWMGILFSSAFFAVAHMDLFNIVPLLVLGIALGYVYDRTRSLVAPVVLHVTYNAMVILLVFANRAVLSPH